MVGMPQPPSLASTVIAAVSAADISAATDTIFLQSNGAGRRSKRSELESNVDAVVAARRQRGRHAQLNPRDPHVTPEMKPESDTSAATAKVAGNEDRKANARDKIDGKGLDFYPLSLYLPVCMYVY